MAETTRRDFNRALLYGVGATMAGCGLSESPGGAPHRKPNLLLIMTDQQRFDALSLAGNSILQTPHLDRLGREGAYFKRAITPCPVCAPARTSILTGCSIEHTGVRTNNMAFSPKSDGLCPMETFDEVLASQGYYAEYHGKYHSPIHRSGCYDEFRYTLNPSGRYSIQDGYEEYLDGVSPKRRPVSGEQMDSYFERPYRMDPIDARYGLEPTDFVTDHQGQKKKPAQAGNHGLIDIPAHASYTAYQARACIAALERAKKTGKPFTITCSFRFPHAPMLVCEPYYSMFPPEQMPVPESIDDLMQNSPYASANKRKWNPQYRDRDKIRYMISSYYGLVREIDDWVGRILRTLRDIGEADNTLVIFTSDHGEMLGAHGMREKNIFYEESVRVPLLVRFPGRIRSGTSVDDPVSLVDLFPTILDYLGVGKCPSDGRSLRGLVEGRDDGQERCAVSEWNHDQKGDWLRGPNFCVRTRDWKLLFCRKPVRGVIDCLYDLRNDPNEMNNLIGRNPDRARYAERAEHMKSLLVRELDRIGHQHTELVRKKPAVFYEPA
jgi:arylsulfatase A-like enzyme